MHEILSGGGSGQSTDGDFGAKHRRRLQGKAQTETSGKSTDGDFRAKHRRRLQGKKPTETSKSIFTSVIVYPAGDWCSSEMKCAISSSGASTYRFLLVLHSHTNTNLNSAVVLHTDVFQKSFVLYWRSQKYKWGGRFCHSFMICCLLASDLKYPLSNVRVNM
jgi:hypothetical protein